VLVQATGLDTYPDLSVVCGTIERDAIDKNAITNPILLVEVSSPGTQAYDRGRKLDHYRRIPSLREVVLVSHSERRIEVHRRVEGDEWTVEAAETGAIRLQSLDCELPVEDVFRDPLA
jgi:Uma2 family endonuclease